MPWHTPWSQNKEKSLLHYFNRCDISWPYDSDDCSDHEQAVAITHCSFSLPQIKAYVMPAHPLQNSICASDWWNWWAAAVRLVMKCKQFLEQRNGRVILTITRADRKLGKYRFHNTTASRANNTIRTGRVFLITGNAVRRANILMHWFSNALYPQTPLTIKVHIPHSLQMKSTAPKDLKAQHSHDLHVCDECM